MEEEEEEKEGGTGEGVSGRRCRTGQERLRTPHAKGKQKAPKKSVLATAAQAWKH